MRFFFPLLSIALTAAALLPSLGRAAMDTDLPPLRLERLNLTNGRKLSDVLVQSYDGTTNRFFIVVDNTATVLPAELVAAREREEMKSAVKRIDSTPREPIIRPSTPAPRFEAATSRTDQTAPPASVENEPPQATVAAHRGAALAHAERFYRFEYRAGSNQVSVTSLDFDLSDPESIPGWSGRYRTTGRAFLEFFDSRGNSFQRATSTFEIITEQKPGEPLTVARFERKS